MAGFRANRKRSPTRWLPRRPFAGLLARLLLRLPGDLEMRVAALMLDAIREELEFIHSRGGKNVHVEAKHSGRKTLVATIESSLGADVEIRSFECVERRPRKSSVKRIV